MSEIRQWFFPTQVNHFMYGSHKTIEFLFPVANPGSAYSGHYDWPSGGRINPNFGGWGEHGEQRYIHRLHIRHNGAVYWAVDNNAHSNSTAGLSSDVPWTYDAADLNSGSGTGHVLHSDWQSEGGYSDALGYISITVRGRMPITINMSDADPYSGDATEDYGWYPGNYSDVAAWVNDLYGDSEKHYPYMWHVALGCDDETFMAPIQMKNTDGTRYSIPSYDANVSSANAIANSNPTNCLDLIDGSTDPMTDVNPRFDTKYDGVGQGDHDGMVYFKMPEWEGGMWAHQEFSGTDVNDISKYQSGNSGGLHVRFFNEVPDGNSTQRDGGYSGTMNHYPEPDLLIHEAFTDYGAPAGRGGVRSTAAGGPGVAVKRARFMMAVSWYANGPSDREGMGQLTFSGPTVSGESGSNEDLNDAFEERGWVLGWYAYRGGTGRTSRFKSGCGRWQMDATVDASERYGRSRDWHGGRYQTICNSFAKYASNDGGNVNLDCGDTSEVGVRPSDLAMGILLDPDKPYLRYSMTGLPTGLEFDPENRVIHGILPTASSSVNTTVTYKATDFLNNTTSLTFTLTAVGNQDANHVDGVAAAAAAQAAADVAAAEAATAAADALAAAQADQYQSELAAAEAMVILGSGIRRTRDLSTDLVRPDKYLDADLLTSDDPKGIPVAVTPDAEQGELLDYMW